MGAAHSNQRKKKVYLLKVMKRVLQSFYKRQESIPEQIPHVPSGAVCLLTPSELRDRSILRLKLDQIHTKSSEILLCETMGFQELDSPYRL